MKQPPYNGQYLTNPNVHLNRYFAFIQRPLGFEGQHFAILNDHFNGKLTFIKKPLVFEGQFRPCFDWLLKAGWTLPSLTIVVIQELFEMFDKDKSGAISVKELKMGLRATGSNPTKQEIKEIMDEMGIKKGTQYFICSQFTLLSLEIRRDVEIYS